MTHPNSDNSDNNSLAARLVQNVPTNQFLEGVQNVQDLPAALTQISVFNGRALEVERELNRLKCCHGVDVDLETMQVTVWQFDHSQGSFGLQFALHHGYPNGRLQCKPVELVGQVDDHRIQKYVKENKGFNRITNICACVREYCLHG